MSATSLLYVFIGGGLGSVLRFFLSWWIQKQWMAVFPLGTLLVNVLGCLTMGYLFALFAALNKTQEAYKVLLMVGFCGGFTTFSSFALELFNVFHQQEWGVTLLYFVGTNLLCILAIGAGNWMYRFTAA